jgi:hypothetical protein
LSIASQRAPAFAAEILAGLVRSTALWTPARKRRTAFRAEFAPLSLLKILSQQKLRRLWKSRETSRDAHRRQSISGCRVIEI